MSPTLSSLKAVTPIFNNVFMDINSDPEAKQEPQEVELIIQQAWEKLRLVNEAQERHWEEWKRLEEKVQLVTAMQLVAPEAVEFVVEREQRIVLWVSFGFHQLLDWS